MGKSLCHGCVEDPHLSRIILDEGHPEKCAACNGSRRKAITLTRLGQIIEPIMREHFELGEYFRRSDDSDKDWFEQDGDPMSYAVQAVLGQYFSFENEIVDAVVSADDYWPPDGGEPYWDATSQYISTRIRLSRYLSDWEGTLTELKHGRRFFSPSAMALFDRLFDGIDDLKAKRSGRLLPVARLLPKGHRLFRARVCESREVFAKFAANPMEELGPPPKSLSRAGRMNAAGVVVLYAARDSKTALAEMRPALGNEVAIMEMETTRALRVLDFARLDAARSDEALSYFQPDFRDQLERREFLRRLHSLISQPIVPGRESDYLITQTMAEYLAHLHKNPFDGILFSSAQRARGVNFVLFPQKELVTNEPADAFRVRYVHDSLRLMSTTGVRYFHQELDVLISDDGQAHVYDHFGPDLE